MLILPVILPLGTMSGVWSHPCWPLASIATTRRHCGRLVGWKAIGGIVTSSEVAVGGRLSARTMGCAPKTSKLEVAGESRMRWLATVVLLDTFHRKITFSPACAINSGGRMIVVIPYQLKPKGTMRTTDGLFAISGGAVRNGW